MFVSVEHHASADGATVRGRDIRWRRWFGVWIMNEMITFREDVLWAVEIFQGKKRGWSVAEVFYFGSDAEDWIAKRAERRLGPRSEMRVVKFIRETPNK